MLCLPLDPCPRLPPLFHAFAPQLLRKLVNIHGVRRLVWVSVQQWQRFVFSVRMGKRFLGISLVKNKSPLHRLNKEGIQRHASPAPSRAISLRQIFVLGLNLKQDLCQPCCLRGTLCKALSKCKR